MKKVFLFTALAIAAMTSCSKEGGNNDAGASSGKLISMRAVIDKPGNSRAAAMTTDRLSSFHVLAEKYGSRDLSYLNTAVFSSLDENSLPIWKYSPRAYYPADETPLDFFAYAPISDVNMADEGLGYWNWGPADKVSFEYTVPSNQNMELAEDLLVSSVLGNEYNSGNPVVFTFNHALSAATFSATNENGENSELVYVIHSIEITNLCTKGKFFYYDSDNGIATETGYWEQEFANETYIAPIPNSGVAVEPGNGGGGPLLSENDFLIILPQNLTWATSPELDNGTRVEVRFSVRDGKGDFLYQDETCRFANTTISSFDPGVRYDFSFRFKASNAVTMDVNKVTDWVQQ